MTRIVLPFAALITILIVSGCDEENVTETIVQRGLVEFEKSELSLSEGNEKTTISLAFNKQAARDGELQIQVSSSNIEEFQLEPALVEGAIKLPFLKGQSKISFDVTPIDNDLLDGDKTLDFTIASVTEGYDIGPTKTLATLWVDDESPAQVNFEHDASQARENSVAGYPITISFSHAAKADGLVNVSIESVDAVYGVHFTTIPLASNGVITLAAERGSNQVVFNVFPLDDELYNAHRSINYTIIDAEGGLEKGDILQHDLKITDDELEGAGKGYEVVAGNWRYTKQYEYDQYGAISKVYWDQYTPGHTGGIYTYVYNAARKLEKIIQSSVREEIFLREGDRIVRSEEYTNGELTKYTLFGYDQAGNVAEAAVHYRQPDGTLKLSLIFVYLYHMDHNVYKVLSYDASEGPEDPILISTKTFDYYLDVENPFPMVEVLPDQRSQSKLPGSYRVEENGHDIIYQFTYQLSNEGKPLSRTATSPGKSETAQYQYY